MSLIVCQSCPSARPRPARGLVFLLLAGVLLALPGPTTEARGEGKAPRLLTAEGALQVIDARGRLELDLPLGEGVLVR